MRYIFSLLLVTSQASAHELCYLGDSQSASAGRNNSLFQNISSVLHDDGDLVGGLAICGAPIAGYLGHDQNGCSYSGVTHLEIRNGQTKVVPGGGRTMDVGKLCAQADTVVIQLGDNDIGNPSKAAQNARALATKLKGKACVWIGPASIGSARCAANRLKKQAVSKAIAAALKGTTCKFVDSFAATDSNPPLSKDPMCLHYPALYPQWAAAIRKPLANALKDANSNSSSKRASPTSDESNEGLLTPGSAE